MFCYSTIQRYSTLIMILKHIGFFYFIDARNAGLREHFNVTEKTLKKIQSSIYSPILTKEINTLKNQLQYLKKDEEEL